MRPVPTTSERRPLRPARSHRRGKPAPWFALAAVAFLAAVVVGCGGTPDEAASAEAQPVAADAGADPAIAAAATDIFDTDFLGACDGVGFDQATSYVPTAGVIHPVVVLTGEGTEMYGRTTAVREAWTRQWTPEAPLALSAIELVACAEKQSSTVAQECSGYEIDGIETDNVVRLNEVVYAVTLRAALTGVEVASTTITARDAECPMFVSFTEGEQVTEYDSFDDLALQQFLEPYVAP
jgi:hypothetical protein